MTASETRLYHRLQIAAHRAQKAADRALMEAAGVTTAQSAVLTVTSLSEPATQRHVAEQLGINESAMTAMVTRLLRMGLLDRSRDPDDVRAWRLVLTAEGRAALKRIKAAFKPINRTFEQTLSEPEITDLADRLTRLGDAFGGR